MMDRPGYIHVHKAEVLSNRQIQELIDFGAITMLVHLEEDGLIDKCSLYELFDDYHVYQLILGDEMYYKFYVELTNDKKMVRATMLIMRRLDTDQEFLEDYHYEISNVSKPKK